MSRRVITPPSLVQALDGMEPAFGPRDGRIPTVEGCRNCCFTQADLDTLSGPVALIDDEALRRVLFTWGGTLDDSVELMRRITPPLLRSVVEGTQLFPELVANRFVAAGWREWPEAERSAVEAVCAAWWAAILAGPADGWSASSALGFLVPLTGEVDTWLDVWSRTSGRDADLQVRDVWLAWWPDILEGRLDVAVYAPGPNIAPEVAAWLLRDGMHRLAEGDLDESAAWALEQLPRPVEERWR